MYLSVFQFFTEEEFRVEDEIWQPDGLGIMLSRKRENLI